MPVEPYLNFQGRCEEAVEFYKKAVGAEVEMMMRFNESPEPSDPNMVAPGSENKVMHASVRIAKSRIMASDCENSGNASFVGVSLALSLPTEAAVEKAFHALSEGGQVHVPLTKTFFSSKFGVLADKFGVSWMLVVEEPK
jgi:PhnB protein